MITDTVLVEINEDIYTEASSKVENISEYIEQQLIILINDDFNDELELLMQLSEKIDEIKELEARLTQIRENRLQKVTDITVFTDAMVSITRIHDNLGMIGKNQIKSIAKRNHVSYDSLLSHVGECGYNIVNYTGVSKK